MTEVMTFANALGRSDPGKRKLLLGNGFSIAWRATAFTYRSLLEAADLSRLPRAKAVFDALAERLDAGTRGRLRVDIANDPAAPVGVRK